MPEISAADARKRSSVRTDLLSSKRDRVNLMRNWALVSGRDGERIARLPDTIRPPNIRRPRLYARRRVLSPCRVSRESCSPLSSPLAENEERARSSRSFPTRFAVVAFQTIAKRARETTQERTRGEFVLSADKPYSVDWSTRATL